MTEPAGTPAYRCAICTQYPQWRLERRGDAVVSWADGEHLSAVVRHLQRDEHTELVITRAAAPAAR